MSIEHIINCDIDVHAAASKMEANVRFYYCRKRQKTREKLTLVWQFFSLKTIQTIVNYIQIVYVNCYY